MPSLQERGGDAACSATEGVKDQPIDLFWTCMLVRRGDRQFLDERRASGKKHNLRASTVFYISTLCGMLSQVAVKPVRRVGFGKSLSTDLVALERGKA